MALPSSCCCFPCCRWLDELIVALWHDLQSFLDWKALDTELADAGGAWGLGARRGSWGKWHVVGKVLRRDTTRLAVLN